MNANPRCPHLGVERAGSDCGSRKAKRFERELQYPRVSTVSTSCSTPRSQCAPPCSYAIAAGRTVKSDLARRSPLALARSLCGLPETYRTGSGVSMQRPAVRWWAWVGEWHKAARQCSWVLLQRPMWVRCSSRRSVRISRSTSRSGRESRARRIGGCWVLGAGCWVRNAGWAIQRLGRGR